MSGTVTPLARLSAEREVEASRWSASAVETVVIAT